MRIRRRPQCVSLQSSDPSTSTAATQNAAARSREGGGGDGVGRRLHQLHHHGNVDLGKKSSGVARRRLALLQQVRVLLADFVWFLHSWIRWLRSS